MFGDSVIKLFFELGCILVVVVVRFDYQLNWFILVVGVVEVVKVLL